MNYARKVFSGASGKFKRAAIKYISDMPEIQEIKARARQVDSIVGHVMFKDLPEGIERQNMQFFDRLYTISGALRSSAGLTPEAKLMAEVYFHHREKAEVAMTAASSWYGGDYFEFGSHDLSTFRSMLSAYDICAMTQNYKDVRFYAFDIFGDPTVNAKEGSGNKSAEDLTSYFGPYTLKGDQIKVHEEYLDHHNLFRNQCYLVQGLFQNTLTKEFKEKYKSENRKIGFAFLDCNMSSSYITVFEFIFDLMAENSYIYMDEYLQNTSVVRFYEQFVRELGEKRNMGSVYIRNAGGFGGLFRLYPLGDKEGKKLNLKSD